MTRRKEPMSLGDLIRAQMEESELLSGAPEPVRGVESYGVVKLEVTRHVSTADRKIPLLERLKTAALLDLVLVLSEVARVKSEDEEELLELEELVEMEKSFGAWG